MAWFRKLLFEYYYLGSPPWDTGITPPELERFIAGHPPGRALDLGCGTGTNLLTLARAGWEGVGVDFIGRAVRAARRKARGTGLPVAFKQGDVTKLTGITGPFDLIYDIGCFHSIPPAGHEDYAQNILRLLTPEGTFMMYAFFREPDDNGPGILQPELDAAFKDLQLEHREDGSDRGTRQSAWFWFKKKTN